jgi:hypothetical protein
MKYNIKNTDINLAMKLNSQEGSKIKSDLKHKIIELENMLDLFKLSINHCNRLVQYCTEKEYSEQDNLKQQEYKAQRLTFEDNKLIWNISGFITLISIDIKTIQIGMYFAESEWHKRFYARQICTIMYESSIDIFELLGKKFNSLISERIDIAPFIQELNDIRNRLNLFKNTNADYLNCVRNNTSAHKDKDVLNQINIISNINWSDTINTTMTFEIIINDLGAFLQKLMKLGLGNINDSPMGQNRI